MVMDINAVEHESVPFRWTELDVPEIASVAADIQIY
jgi:hypothetical protein